MTGIKDWRVWVLLLLCGVVTFAVVWWADDLDLGRWVQ